MKSNPDVRFFQEGQRFMRIHFNDFKEMIEEKVTHSMEQLHGIAVENNVKQQDIVVIGHRSRTF